MKIRVLENGKRVIENDEHILSEIQGEDLSAVDVSDIRVTADNLSKLFDIADRTKDPNDIKGYAKLKEKFLENSASVH